MMKTTKIAILFLTLVTGTVAFAQKAPFDYPELIPAAPITISEAKIILSRADAIKEHVTDKSNEIKKVKSDQLAGWVAHKKNIIQQAQTEIDNCLQNPECVNQANKKLTSDISVVHEKMREVNTFYDKQVSEEEIIVRRKLTALAQALEANKNAVIVNSLQEELKKRSGAKDFILETNPNVDTALSAESARKQLSEIAKAGYYMYWNVSDGKAYSFSSFYFRTSKAENHMFLALTPVFGQNYDDLKAELLDPMSDNTKSIFGIKKEELAKEVITATAGEHFYSPTCMGYEKDKSKGCIAIMKNDSVSLE